MGCVVGGGVVKGGWVGLYWIWVFWGWVCEGGGVVIIGSDSRVWGGGMGGFLCLVGGGGRVVTMSMFGDRVLWLFGGLGLRKGGLVVGIEGGVVELSNISGVWGYGEGVGCWGVGVVEFR
uniref:Uncharacterized protein n=1 Tax=Knipowitschia caucasica TaxID=637954 RepID=A0AAV2MQW5_KNICA